MEFLATIVGQILGAILWSFFNAGLLIWRALKMKHWAVHFRDAYVVSIKAALIAVVIADIAQAAVAVAGGHSDDLLRNVGLLFGVVAWWFAHSSALLRLAGNSITLTVKEARSVSASVFGFAFGGVMLISLAIGLIIVVVGALK